MHRPVHVTAAAVLTLAWAGYSLVFGALYAKGIIEVPAVEQMPTPPNLDPAVFRTLIGAITMLTAVLWAPIGIALLRLKRWARTLTLILCGIALPMDFLAFALSFRATFGVWLLVVQVASIVSAAVVIWLLLQAPVKDAFGVVPQPQAGLAARKERPTGITVLVVICVLGAVGALGFGVVFAVIPPFLDTSMKSNPETVRLMRTSMIVGTLPWAAGYALCALGLWRLKNWGRILAIVFAAFWLLPALTMLVALIRTFLAAPSLVGAAIFILVILFMAAIPAWSLWYLFRPRTKQLFTSSAPAPPSFPAA